MEVISDSLGDFIFASITDEGIHGSPFSDVVRESVDELFGRFHAIGITDKSITATEELGHGGTIINSRSVRKDGVCCNSFTASGDVENRIARLKVLFDVILGMWSSPMPGGDIESVLDAGWGCPCKEWA